MKQLPNSRRPADPAGRRRKMGQQRRHLKLIKGKATRQRGTLLELVRKIQDSERGDEEVVATIARLIESGRVVLSGTFAGTSSEPSEIRKTVVAGGTAPASVGTLRFAR